ncbi:MAG: flagellar motor protein MotB [Alphaproteobacteria bacterium]
MADERKILIKKVKIQEPGHSGGAWKIAYADFVTAMMAFFLLLWLLNATSEEVREGLSNYFQPTIRTTPSTSGAGGIFGGVTVNDPGPVDLASPMALLDSDSQSQTNLDTGNEASGRDEDRSSGNVGRVDAKAEEQSFARVKQIVENSVDVLPPELTYLKESIKVDITEEGLRIQIVDNSDKSIFQVHQDRLTREGRTALQFIAQFIANLPNDIAITGHTGEEGSFEANWKLSLDRANASRRTLNGFGIGEQRFETIIGRGATELAKEDDPTAPENRRIGVVLERMARQNGPLTAEREDTPSIFDSND